VARKPPEPIDGQEAIPVPESPPTIAAKAKLTKEDRARLYGELMGTVAEQRQRELQREATKCNCSESHDTVIVKKKGVYVEERRFRVNAALHAPECKYKPLREGK